MEKDLLKAYKEIFRSKNNEPSWAAHKALEGHNHELIHPSIPFVGKDYDNQPVRILVYASAENLANYGNKEKLYDDEWAVNRHRNCFEVSKTCSDLFFPNVHIQPMNDGGLAIVALYVYLKFCNVDKVTPFEFLEKIAVANYCKYTKTPVKVGNRERNEDYANNSSKLECSHDYIEKDIAILKPDYIIMPKSIWNTDNKKFISKVKGETQIIPIYQINAGTINRTINRNSEYSVKGKRVEDLIGGLDEVLRLWYMQLGNNGLKGKTHKNFLSVFAYMDDMLKKYINI